MPAPVTSSDEAIRIFQKASLNGDLAREDRAAAAQYLRNYATAEAVRLDPTGSSDVAPDITERLDALEEEWRSR